ncbi:hypothetical protein ACQFX9_16890 [Aliinostoc sp. HNIBRCY26]|uniref:hypothetical protein n=1 Tax=Aliinostoc sp. HNIBRCY26 TaxID=3418997 RepID=UPI003D06C080
MNLPSLTFANLLKITLFLTGLVCGASLLSAPASAQAIIENPISDFSSGEPSSFAGAAIYITPGAYLSSIAAETVAPRGTYFAGINGTYTVTAISYIDPITHVSTPRLTLHTGGLIALPYNVAGSIRGAIVDRLRNGNLTLDEFTAIVRAAIGSDGLD